MNLRLVFITANGHQARVTRHEMTVQRGHAWRSTSPALSPDSTKMSGMITNHNQSMPSILVGCALRTARLVRNAHPT